MNSQFRTTEECILQLQRGKNTEEIFRHLFETYYTQIHNFLRRKGLSPDDCRDLTQEVFLSVYRNLDDLRDCSNFEAWLFKIALNAYRNRIERSLAGKRAAQLVSMDAGLLDREEQCAPSAVAIDPGSNPMEATLERERLDKLREAVHQLPDQMRRCTQLRVLNDLSYQEIASVLGISINTVKTQLHRAQRVLRDKLRPYFGEMET